MSKKKAPKRNHTKKSRTYYANLRKQIEATGTSTKGFGSARTVANRVKLSKLAKTLAPVIKEPKKFVKIKIDRVKVNPFPIKTKEHVFVPRMMDEKSGRPLQTVRVRDGMIEHTQKIPLGKGRSFVQRQVFVLEAGDDLRSRVAESRELHRIRRVAYSYDRFNKGKKGGKKFFGAIQQKNGQMSKQIPLPLDRDTGGVEYVEQFLSEFEERYSAQGRTESDIDWLLDNMYIGYDYIE